MIRWKDIPNYGTLNNHVPLVRFEIYEDNGGGLYLCIMASDGERCCRIFENWEYSGDSCLKNALEQLCEDETAYELWDGDLSERTGFTEQALYENGLGELVADNDGVYERRMGYAAHIALEISFNG